MASPMLAALATQIVPATAQVPLAVMALIVRNSRPATMASTMLAVLVTPTVLEPVQGLPAAMEVSVRN